MPSASMSGFSMTSAWLFPCFCSVRTIRILPPSRYNFVVTHLKGHLPLLAASGPSDRVHVGGGDVGGAVEGHGEDAALAARPHPHILVGRVQRIVQGVLPVGGA